MNFSTTTQRALPWFVTAAGTFLLGRHLSHHSVDFIVYYRAARSLLAGRTDLYSNTFSWGPPMIYVYPPLFLLLIFPLGWLSFANAFGVWFALMILATAAVMKRSWGQWRPRSHLRYAWLLIALPGPYIMWTLRYGNAQVFVALITVLAILAWCRGDLWRSSFMLALGGVIKIFPLLLTLVFLVRKEWGLAARVAVVSCVLWLLPGLYFGPRRTVALYRSWYKIVVRDTEGYRRKRALDESLTGIMERWFTRVDYSEYKDRAFPQVDVLSLPRGIVTALIAGGSVMMIALSLWMCARLRSAGLQASLTDARSGMSRPEASQDQASLSSAPHRSRNTEIATAACIFVTAQIFLGPYTAFLYPSGWFLVALALPVITAGHKRLANLFLGVATVNVLLFAMPGSANQRALQAWGVFSLVGLFLWILLMCRGWNFVRS